MGKTFNTDGYCDPELHYMVNLSQRLKQIKTMVDDGKYFAINRARQYGKTTILAALSEYLRTEYAVISLDFQGISYGDFQTEQAFAAAFSRQLLITADWMPDEVKEELMQYASGRQQTETTLSVLFASIVKLCRMSPQKIVLMIDEVDSATNNQVFTDFLAQLRFYYLKRRKLPAFQSVILAGVYDIRNIKQKIRPDAEHKINSPWNIAADFPVRMDFSPQDIAGMLNEYEADHHTGMDIRKIANLLYEYTSGYPYLVSRLCKFMDAQLAESESMDKSGAWTKEGFLSALKRLLNETNPLYQSLKEKLDRYPELRALLYDLLFTGKSVPYTVMNDYIEVAAMFGFIKNVNGTAAISNRIFETVLYNWFMAEEYGKAKIYDTGLMEKNQFITGGHLNVRKILEKFTESFNDLYGDQDETFLEDAGRRYFMLFLKPIINGTGNCYVEPETRNRERMDLVIDYLGEQFIIEMKIWRGNAYHERGEEQLLGYLEHFHLNKGYMLSFNFNKKKQVGVKDIVLGDKLLVEAVV